MTTARSASQASTSGRDHNAVPAPVAIKGLGSRRSDSRRTRSVPMDDNPPCESDATALLLNEDLGMFYLEGVGEELEGCEVEGTSAVFSRIIDALSGMDKDEKTISSQVVAAMASGNESVEGLAASLHNAGLAAGVRKGLPGKDCLHNLRNTFVIVTICHATGLERTVIVDPHFRDHFHISRPTAQYISALDQIPEVFVGSSFRLRAVVEIMADEMNRSFRDAKISLPPWRANSSLLSKWLPNHYDDASPSPTSAPKKTKEVVRSTSPVSVLYGPGFSVQGGH